MAAFASTTKPFALLARPSKSRTNANGPVTEATRAMRAAEPPRRALLKAGTLAAALGALFGILPAPAGASDHAPDAERFMEEAASLGVWFTIDSRTGLWTGVPVKGTVEERQARETLRQRLDDDAELRQAVLLMIARGAAGPVEAYS